MAVDPEYGTASEPITIDAPSPVKQEPSSSVQHTVVDDRSGPSSSATLAMDLEPPPRSRGGAALPAPPVVVSLPDDPEDVDELAQAQASLKKAVARQLLVWSFNPAFAAKHEDGKGILLRYVRRRISQRPEQARLERLVVHTKFLALVYTELQVDVLQPLAVRPSDEVGCASVIQMMFSELNGVSDVDEIDVAEEALDHLTNAIVALSEDVIARPPVWFVREEERLGGHGAKDGRSFLSAFSPPEVQLLQRIRDYQCSRDDKEWTHSSLMGGRDWFTSTGKLKVPDNAFNTMAEAVAISYRAGRPMVFVERQSPHYPYTEDVDILAPACDAPPDDLLHPERKGQWFWRRRAEILKEMYPQINPLTLVLFTASGWTREKNCPKSSFHCVWPDLIVDMERAHVIRLKTLDRMAQDTKIPNGRVERLHQQLAGLMHDPTGRLPDVPDVWDTVFDITAVRCGSLRLPFNDKWHHPSESLERRAMLPIGMYEFWFDGSQPPYCDEMRLVAGPQKYSIEKWVWLGSIRRSEDTPLTVWKTPIPDSSWKDRRKPSARSSVNPRRPPGYRGPPAPSYEDEQRRIRRRFIGTPLEMKANLDVRLGDEEGLLSTLQELPGARPMWVWKRKGLKGAVHFRPSDGELLCSGNAEQQTFLVDLCKDWTQGWEGSIPKPAKGSKGSKGKSDSGKGKGGKGKQGKRAYGRLGELFISRQKGDSSRGSSWQEPSPQRSWHGSASSDTYPTSSSRSGSHQPAPTRGGGRQHPAAAGYQRGSPRHHPGHDEGWEDDSTVLSVDSGSRWSSSDSSRPSKRGRTSGQST
eukprot:EG_transcript_2404